MIFWRIVNDNLYNTNSVDTLGFEKSDPSYIPDEYLEKQIFTICRTCLGIGDWGGISAMPRLLKKKYPNCYFKSGNIMKSIDGHKNLYSHIL